ncbi:MAG: restriction endonuclease subunit S, partial [Lachnospiraceae bacterium]|nr:restriction endonuclease subunit S [Lachnospiraceae bacterium]
MEVPALERQAEIVDILDTVNRAIEQRGTELEELDNLIKSRFVEMFGERGKVVPLTDYVWFQEGPGVRSIDFTLEGTILLTGSNINDNQISFGYKSDRFISDELANGKYAHFMCDKDDILVVSSAIAPEKFDKKVTTVEEDKKYCLNTGIIRFKPNREVMTLGYFREFLKTDYFKHQVMAEMRGIAQMHFGPSHLKQMTILLPDTMEQQIEFEQFVNQVTKLKFELICTLNNPMLKRGNRYGN